MNLNDDIQKEDISDFIDDLISIAIERGASDIHIEPFDDYSKIRLRIDGKLNELMKFDSKKHQQVITKIKILSGMDISERRLPQDGRIEISKYENTDFRVSCINTINGEKIEIRVLSFSQFKKNSDLLGFSENSKKLLKKVINSKSGMLIFSGPTGSGKTTSLYSLLEKVNTPQINIVTAEDPVEYNLEGINQIEVKEEIGLTFDTILRSILRQDPDIIMVGEIRDKKTAQMAVRSAITGHLVLTTLHTDSALSSIVRLKDLGIEEYLLASSVDTVASQRLVRKLCDNCKKEDTMTESEYETASFYFHNLDRKSKIFRPNRCDKCNNGYTGRVAVEEVFQLDKDTKSAIKSGNFSSNDLYEIARKNGFVNIMQRAIELVLEGVTSFEEINSILYNYSIGEKE
ncbi:MAG: GspE/PulE family protein [Peptoniphilaceae bacterium]|nr:GspE/PulE family protein [Peptoniphilaceae bacterium]MDD7382986.1 GspE/PulE family protein [Peptoniphilaceae bacterium]MDY3737737.1 GspE/PulE family protein [Peptoniphilaceae bacterium]